MAICGNQAKVRTYRARAGAAPARSEERGG
ncbi:MAG: hypothetical protein ABR600_11325 [Actinomycetota bacterium]